MTRLRRTLSVLVALAVVLTTANTAAGQEQLTPTSDPTTTTETPAALRSDQNVDDGVGPAIIGGTDAKLRNHPYYVMLVDNTGFFFCGGTLIRERWVLTAAHCAQPYGDRDITVRFGVRSETDYVDSVQSSRVISHPGFNWELDDPDIALIELERKPNMDSPFVGTARLNLRHDLPKVGSVKKIIGYGLTEPNGDVAESLQVATVKIKMCDGSQTDDNQVNNICAGGEKRTACNGDSGSPLLVGKSVAGITSRGPSVCGEGYGVFTRVSKHAAWVRQQIGGNPQCGGREVTVNLANGEQPTAGDDVILGTPGDDVIDALAGNDTICGRGGKDTINGGAGRDRLIGGAALDTCNGGPGKDIAIKCENVSSAVERVASSNES